MDIANFSIEILTFLFFVGVVAGFLDTLVGGGGLLAVPALLLSGIPPLYVLGTNKFQGSMGTGIATFLLFRKKKLDWNSVKNLMFASFIGSIVGGVIIQFVDTQFLSFVIPIVLVFIAIYFIVSPKPKSTVGNSKPNKKFELFAVPVVGFYDGMFGPGAGSFFAMTGVMLKKLEIIQATILAKPLNFASNIAGFIVFFSFGHIAFLIGILMMMGQMIGAFFGTHYLLKANPLIIRFLIVIISISMLIKYMLSLS
ncbi:TSUP family transporter [Candidatus Pseudothioglobus singularis]|nr:TSUP family transporter [Candidatus Pseudothioglobus singularis]